MELSLLHASEIDKNKWNGCVHYANNGRVYGYHWYLQSQLNDWYGIIENDYESVFPIAGDKEKRNPVLQESAFPIEIYSINVLSPVRLKRFLRFAHEHKRDENFTLRSPISADALELTDWYSSKKIGQYTLEMGSSYEKISSDYAKAQHHELSEGESGKVRYKSGINPDSFVEFAKKNRKKKFDPHSFGRVMFNAMHRGIGNISSIEDESTGSPLAMAAWIYSHGRVEFIDSCIDQQSTADGSLRILIDGFLRTHSGNPLLLMCNNMDAKIVQSIGASESKSYALEHGSAAGFLNLDFVKNFWKG